MYYHTLIFKVPAVTLPSFDIDNVWRLVEDTMVAEVTDLSVHGENLHVKIKVKDDHRTLKEEDPMIYSIDMADLLTDFFPMVEFVKVKGNNKRSIQSH